MANNDVKLLIVTREDEAELVRAYRRMSAEQRTEFVAQMEAELRVSKRKVPEREV